MWGSVGVPGARPGATVRSSLEDDETAILHEDVHKWQRSVSRSHSSEERQGRSTQTADGHSIKIHSVVERNFVHGMD